LARLVQLFAGLVKGVFPKKSLPIDRPGFDIADIAFPSKIKVGSLHSSQSGAGKNGGVARTLSV
jgi:hypothetical protein